jgi:DNA-binding response OmpR family regulator
MTTGAHTEKEVLVIEDDRAILQMLEMALEMEGYSVLLAGTAQCALDLLVPPVWDQSGAATRKVARPDLILLDLQLPDIKGDDLVKQITLANQPVPPVIILSAKRRDAVETAAREIGAAGIVFKPFEIDKLLCSIDTVLSCAQAPISADC